MGKKLTKSDFKTRYSKLGSSLPSVPIFEGYRFRLKSYLKYKLKAKGIILMHSPFVYNLQKDVLYKKHHYDRDVIQLRKEILNSNIQIDKRDYGSGAKKHGKQYNVKVSKIAKSSSKSTKTATIIAELAKYLKATKIVELGTSLGFTTAIIARKNREAEIITIDGAKSVVDIAVENFHRLKINNIKAICSEFDTELNKYSSYSNSPYSSVDMVLFDGNHQKEATLKYFDYFLQCKHNNTVFVFDDIYWSKGMHKAWQQIKNHPEVTLSIDLYELGIVFFRKEIKQKRDFVIKY